MVVDKNKQSMRHIVRNNIWMLGIILRHAPSLILYKAYSVPVLILNTYISINFTRWILNRIEEKMELAKIISFIIYIALFYIITNLIFAFFDIVFVPQKLINLTTKIREEIILKVSKISQINFQKSDFFNIYTLGLNEIDYRASQVLNTVTSALISVLSIFVITGVIATISNSFAIFGNIAAIVDVGLGVVKQKINYKQTIETTPDGRKRGYVNRLTYQPEFAADLKIYPTFKYLLIKNYFDATRRIKAIILRYAKKIFGLDQIQQITSTVCKQAFPWIYIAILLSRGQITIPEATVLATSALTFPSTLVTLMNSVGSFYTHSLYIENMRKILNYQEDIEQDKGEDIDLAIPFNIEVNNISFSYHKGDKSVINNLSMKINTGEKIAIVGYNGAGKSTLVKLLIRLYDVDSGHIKINGKEITDLNTRHIRSHIAFLSQEFKIYSLTVAENVLMRPVSSDSDIELVNDALIKVGLYEKVCSWKKGIQSYITREFDESGEYLSGGEAQKLALARIYAGNYDCIILDESTSALDPIIEDEIISTIFRIFTDKTIIMISHRLATVKYVDRIYFMSDGQIRESGTHKELMALNKEYSQFYSSQADKYNIAV